MDDKTVTCSFVMDRTIYNTYKSIVARDGQNVKGNLVRYMKYVIEHDTPNPDTIAAFEEVNKLKEDPNKKTYSCFAEIMKDIDNE